MAAIRTICACCALWGLSTAALAAPEHVQPVLVESTAAPVAASSTPKDSAARADDAPDASDDSIVGRVLMLVALAGVVGVIAGCRDRRSRGVPLRLLHKPKKTSPPRVLVPPGPVPTLIPAQSPKATRARSSVAVPRQTPAGIPSSGVIDYIAAFSESAKGNEETRVDYVLESGDGEDEVTDPEGCSHVD